MLDLQLLRRGGVNLRIRALALGSAVCLFSQLPQFANASEVDSQLRGVEAFAPSQDNKVTIQGLVTDEKGEPVPGASVMLKGTKTGVITDLDGSFFS